MIMLIGEAEAEEARSAEGKEGFAELIAWHCFVVPAVLLSSLGGCRQLVRWWPVIVLLLLLFGSALKVLIAFGSVSVAAGWREEEAGGFPLSIQPN